VTLTRGCIQYERRRKTRYEFAVKVKVVLSVRTRIITLKRDGYHVMLLQTRQLGIGDRFTCLIDFQKAGTIEREVQVR
jgi:hypothetical protein